MIPLPRNTTEAFTTGYGSRILTNEPYKPKETEGQLSRRFEPRRELLQASSLQLSQEIHVKTRERDCVEQRLKAKLSSDNANSPSKHLGQPVI